MFFSVLSSYKGPKAVKSASLVVEIISSKADPPASIRTFYSETWYVNSHFVFFFYIKWESIFI